MNGVPDELKKVKEEIEAGQNPITTVRTLLSWFGAYRRSWRNVELIRATFSELMLETVPDFEFPYIDATVRFQRKTQPATPAQEQHQQDGQPLVDLRVSEAGLGTGTDLPELQKVEPAHQISRLKSANKLPTWVKPDATVQEAITVMLLNDYSQLPVMQSERDPKGIFSWKSLGTRLSLGQQCKYVRECMDSHKELEPKASLYDAIPLIIQHECVLIRDQTRTISGIVTPADLSMQFQDLAEPFLLVGAIENHLRAWIAARFSVDDLQAAKDPKDTERQVKDITDLTFGEYVRLLENPDNWNRLKTEIDRNTFVHELNKVRDIRNDVMHFDPDPLDPSELQSLRSFALFLDRLDNVGAR
jgi:predicted transcriptional regulator